MTRRDCECDRHDCPTCGPLVGLADDLRREFLATRGDARVPTPEIVWWRAQMRARQEAAGAAARPIMFAQALAVAALIGVVVSLLGRLTTASFSWNPARLITADVPVLAVAAAALVCLAVAPVALYLALSRR